MVEIGEYVSTLEHYTYNRRISFQKTTFFTLIFLRITYFSLLVLRILQLIFLVNTLDC